MIKIHDLKNITLGELKEKMCFENSVINPVQEEINNLLIKRVSKYFKETFNFIQDGEFLISKQDDIRIYKRYETNSIKYKIIYDIEGIDHILFIKTEKKNKLAYEYEIINLLKILLNMNININNK